MSRLLRVAIVSDVFSPCLRIARVHNIYRRNGTDGYNIFIVRILSEFSDVSLFTVIVRLSLIFNYFCVSPREKSGGYVWSQPIKFYLETGECNYSPVTVLKIGQDKVLKTSSLHVICKNQLSYTLIYNYVYDVLRTLIETAKKEYGRNTV